MTHVCISTCFHTMVLGGSSVWSNHNRIRKKRVLFPEMLPSCCSWPIVAKQIWMLPSWWPHSSYRYAPYSEPMPGICSDSNCFRLPRLLFVFSPSGVTSLPSPKWWIQALYGRSSPLLTVGHSQPSYFLSSHLLRELLGSLHPMWILGHSTYHQARNGLVQAGLL